MAEKIYTQQFGEVQNKSVCTTTDDLKFDNFTECGTYHIYEDKGDGCSCTYYLFVDKSANGQTTQTRVHCGKVEYRKQNADGTWTAWSASTGGGEVPENVCAWGGSVSSADELPENPTAGMVCIAKTDFAFNAYKFTGAVNKLFDCWEEENGIWIVRALFGVPNDCITIMNIGFGEERLTHVCDSSGKFVGMVHVDSPNGYPYYFTPDKLGVSDITDTVTVYVPISDGDEYIHPNVVSEGTALIYDGEQWRGLTSTSESGNIESALNSIIAIQNILMGGASV